MLHYTITKKRPTTVLLLHGYCEDSRMWEYFMRGLTNDFQILRIDLPGFGKSDIEGEVSIAEMAQQVQEVIKALGIKEFIFVGHSMGGYVGLEFAKQYPDLLNGLCLFHSHPFADTDEKKRARLISAKSVETSDKTSYVARLLNMLFPEKYTNPPLLDKMIKRAAEYSVEGLANGQRAMGKRLNNAHILQEINCPVQFIIGTEDAAIPAIYSSEQTSLPKVADIHILQGVGHMGMFEKSKHTKQVLKDFLHFCQDFK